MDSREEISRFMDVTGSKDETEARQFLQRSAFNLEKAVNAYFRRQTARPSATEASTSHHASVANGIDPAPLVEGSGKLMATKKRRRPPNDPVISIDDDGILPDAGRGTNEVGDDGVRAPIPSIRDTIVRQTFRETYGGHRAASQHSTLGGGNSNVFEQFHDFQKLSEEQKARLAKRARLERDTSEDGDNNGGAAVPTPSSSALEVPRPDTSSRLQSLFRPPIDLLFGGDWDEALAESRRTSRWLLVNIQMAEEFSCQVLNRDVWSDSTVRDIVKSNFLLWQVYHNSPDGARVCGYYAVHSFPAIFIVDPRTGEKVLSMRDGDRAAFLESLTSFLDQYPNFEATDRLHVGANGASRLKRKGSPRAESSSDGGVEVERKRMRQLVTIEDGEGGVGQTDDNHKDPDEWKKHVHRQGESDEQIEVVLRLPDGRRETIHIFRSTKLLALILRAGAAGFDMKAHIIVLNHPKRVFTMGESDKTANEMGFNRQEVLYLEKIRRVV